MTFRVGMHPAIAAKGKSLEHSVNNGTGVKPTEGDTTLLFPNDSDTISIGEPVICSDQDDNNNQYLGLCVASSALGITVSMEVQTTPATALLIWVPTLFALFPWGTSKDRDTYTPNRGVRADVTVGNNSFPFRNADSNKQYTLQFAPAQNADYSDWEDFRDINDADDFTFAMGWWDMIHDVSIMAEVNLLDPTETVGTQATGRVVPFRMRLFIKNIDGYSE